MSNDTKLQLLSLALSAILLVLVVAEYIYS